MKLPYRSSDLSWAAPPYACGCVLAYADKRLTIFNTYAHPTDISIINYYNYLDFVDQF